MPEWTEGVCGDGAAILRDGEMIPIEDVLSTLNNLESTAAAAVEEMARQAAEAKRMLAAVVLARGGDVIVCMGDMKASRDCVMTIGDHPQTGGKRVRVHRRPAGGVQHGDI